jgi:hypothetical protein
MFIKTTTRILRQQRKVFSIRQLSSSILHSSFPAIDETPIFSPFSQFLQKESYAVKHMDKVAFVDGVTEKQLTFSEVELKLCAWTAMVYGYYYT